MKNMDLTTQELLRVAVGLCLLQYVGYCLLRQKVWVRGPIGLESKVFAWGEREDNQTIWTIHVIIGAVIGVWMFVAPFLF